jgi:hypothetical protein
VIPDRDVWQAAVLLVKRYGEDAMLEAAERADLLLDEGDMAGAETWRRWTVQFRTDSTLEAGTSDRILPGQRACPRAPWPRDLAMKFNCPYCYHTRFQMGPGRIDEARCLWCGKESKIAAPALKSNKAKRTGKPLVRSGRS